MPAVPKPAAWRLATLAVAAACVLFAAPAAANGPRPTRVAVADTGSTAAQTGLDRVLAAALRAELDREGSLRVTPKRRARWVLRGSVTLLQRREMSDRTQVRCKVSLIVAEPGSGAMRMLLGGGATVRGQGDARAMQKRALRAAVRSALGPLMRGGARRPKLAAR